ncbi:MAG: hypothetical protein OMM_05036 [Candidatus Magnetoglobus multicellularis str. Araruama]|uniref:Uncharacterized protein n=1 Tax=Candidatus Magnetoglobus multicellularis str. Araruama TaxID=890399 RepID=A0A1V1NYK6_9BACT|nr:MAG: hypothetical protein OMM_05036 [Candidatus Magnetoglobus multicellularis str. Araruama]
MKISIDSNQFIFGIGGIDPASELLMSLLPALEVKLPRLVIKEVNRNLTETQRKLLFKLFNKCSKLTIIDNPVPIDIVQKYIKLGLPEKADAFISGKSQLGTWGPTKKIQFNIVEKNPPIQNEYHMSIIAAEYFVDNDPGQGNGIPINAHDGNFDSKIENFAIDDIAVNQLSLGTHTLFVRGKNQLGIWGPTKQYPFQRIEKNPPIQETYHMTITDAEYFIDTDPGEGNGMPVLATDSSFDDKIEPFSLSGIAVNHLIPGNHTLFVRGKDNFGRWGKPKAFQFHIDPVAGSADDYYIIAAEYFIDTDPGKGKGIPVKASDGSMDSIYEQFSMDAIDISYLSPGNHRLYVRGKRNDGVWGAIYAKTFYVPEGPLPMPVIIVPAFSHQQAFLKLVTARKTTKHDSVN